MEQCKYCHNLYDVKSNTYIIMPKDNTKEYEQGVCPNLICQSELALRATESERGFNDCLEEIIMEVEENAK